MTMSFIILLVMVLYVVNSTSFKMKSILKSSSLMMISKDTLESMSNEISKVTNTKYKAQWIGGGGGGNAWATTGIIKNELSDSDKQYFFKAASSMSGITMLSAEFEGVKEMFNTNTIKVPEPICFGTTDYGGFIILEKLNFGGYSDGELYGKKLAAMHKCISTNKKFFGWKINNTIGATLQPNNECDKWADFWDKYRLGHMLELAKRDGADFRNEKELREKVYSILDAHDCQPSLCHGDLWSGNQATLSNGDPVIFDPATYYGDPEVDIAMTFLFGANSKQFYQSYWNEMGGQKEGYEVRQIIYNLYHILNHYVLFGGGYLQQSYNMIDRILKY